MSNEPPTKDSHDTLACACHEWPRERCMADGHRPDCTARPESDLDRRLPGLAAFLASIPVPPR